MHSQSAAFGSYWKASGDKLVSLVGTPRSPNHGLLALKLRPWCGDIATDRHNFWVFLYIVRFEALILGIQMIQKEF